MALLILVAYPILGEAPINWKANYLGRPLINGTPINMGLPNIDGPAIYNGGPIMNADFIS